ncbi:MAG: hypothetical protein AUJ49_09465 [Desulfovibrionaceae bacterium CG1_02_65_16]|nr:MAG: hypothetical protein AUJ49_09465 [Desulfovibrionaceae bacterium CG1_02_65_16]
MTRALVLGGVHSGCGKTSVTLGLLRALARLGLVVQPFKAGPDFIDPGLHARAAGRPSHNLDTWMQPPAALRALFARHARDVDVAVVEGVMGLFDGRGGAGEAGSTAHLAKLLGAPALLVFDAGGQARSAAALVQGFARFDPDLRLAGVVANRVSGPRHAALLAEALAEAPEAPLLGCLPRRADIALASRHLGLVTAGDVEALEARLETLADWVTAGLDLGALVEALPEIDLPGEAAESGEAGAPGEAVRLGVAADSAFCFRYEENLRLLAAAGAEIVYFSPLADAALPADLDGLYLPGGYPELNAARLSANASMRAAVRAFCASGRPVWAECGGYMYLLRELTDLCGRVWPMCGALPGRAVMRERRGALGYREARTLASGPFGPEGTVLRGHEFHYSTFVGSGDTSGSPAFALTASDGGERLDGQAAGNVLAGYFHAHLSSNPEAARAFAAACRAGRQATDAKR